MLLGNIVRRHRDEAREAWWFTVEEGLLEEAILVPEPDSGGIAPQITEIESALAAPVPTITPVSLWSSLSE